MEPDWATPGSSAFSQPVAETSNSVTQHMSSVHTQQEPCDVARSDNSNMAQRVLSILNIFLCCLMAALGVMGIIFYIKAPTPIFTDIFVGIYMIIFAGMLFSYEVMWWIPVDFINRSLRKNFGFLYGIRGKAFYIIFVAFLSLAITNNENIEILKWSTGIIWLMVGVLHIVAYFMKPQLFLSYAAPTAGFQSTAAQV